MSRKKLLIGLLVIVLINALFAMRSYFREQKEVTPYSITHPPEKIVVDNISFTTTFPDRSYYDYAKECFDVSVVTEQIENAKYKLKEARFSGGKIIITKGFDARRSAEYSVYDTNGRFIVSYIVTDKSGGASNMWLKDEVFYYYSMRLRCIYEIAPDGSSKMFYANPANGIGILLYKHDRPLTQDKITMDSYTLTVNTKKREIIIVGDNGNTIVIK